MALELNKSDVREYLINLAKQRATCGYKELAEDIAGEGAYTIGNHDGNHVAHIAGLISEDEAAQKRPLLSVLIINQDTKLPGGGFFKLARDLRLFYGEVDNKAHQSEYTNYELARVYGYWSTSFDETDTKEIALLNHDFDASKVPEEKERMIRQIERGQVGDKIKVYNGYKCQICEAMELNPFSFLKSDNIPYIETHHVMPVSSRQKGVLSASNIITVCANHHRQMHYGKVKVDWEQTTNDSFVFEFDGLSIEIARVHII